MKNKTNLALNAVAVAIFFIGSPAQAYLDAGTGSIIAQMIIGGIAGFVVVLKLYWYKIKTFFSRSSSEAAIDESPNDSD